MVLMSTDPLSETQGREAILFVVLSCVGVGVRCFV